MKLLNWVSVWVLGLWLWVKSLFQVPVLPVGPNPTYNHLPPVIDTLSEPLPAKANDSEPEELPTGVSKGVTSFPLEPESPGGQLLEAEVPKESKISVTFPVTPVSSLGGIWQEERPADPLPPTAIGYAPRIETLTESILVPALTVIGETVLAPVQAVVEAVKDLVPTVTFPEPNVVCSLTSDDSVTPTCDMRPTLRSPYMYRSSIRSFR